MPKEPVPGLTLTGKPIIVTLLGIVISHNPEFSNVHIPIVSTPSGITTLVKLLQFENA